MGALTIPNTFVLGTTISADPMNENFADIQTAVNDIDDNNVGPSKLSENRIVFSDTGHNHSGGGDGERVDIIASQLPLAVNNGNKGAVIVKSGNITIAAESNSDTILFTGTAFGQKPLLQVYCLAAGGKFENLWEGTYMGVGHHVFGYSIWDFDMFGFKIKNEHTTERSFYWIAIGI